MQRVRVGFAKVFYPDKLPEDVKPIDFDFWSLPAHRMWRFNLTDPPTATEVVGAPFATIGFGGSMVNEHLFSGESPDGAVSDIYEIDPVTNTATLRFKMDGYFYGLYALSN